MDACHFAVRILIEIWDANVPRKPVDSIADDHESVREATMDLIRVMPFIVEAFQHVDDFSNLTAATAHFA
jgi:FixJ family two-component response regulator